MDEQIGGLVPGMQIPLADTSAEMCVSGDAGFTNRGFDGPTIRTLSENDPSPVALRDGRHVIAEDAQRSRQHMESLVLLETSDAEQNDLVLDVEAIAEIGRSVIAAGSGAAPR